MNSLLDDVAQVLITEEALRKRVAELGARISSDYAGLDPLLLCVLKGGYVFLADLSRSLTIPHWVDFMAVSSYGQNTESTGIVRILMDLETDVSGRHLLIVEDIIDTGYTLSYLLDNLRVRNPATLRICTLLSKPSRRKVTLRIDYLGFEIPDEFVVGYGLDYGQRYRNLPFIDVLRPQVYAAATRQHGPTPGGE